MQYVVECTCGHDVVVDAANRDEAVMKTKEMMDEKGIEKHYKQYHKDEPIPSVTEMHAQIEANIKEAIMA